MIKSNIPRLNWGNAGGRCRKIASKVRFGFIHLNWGRPGESYTVIRYESNPKVTELNYKGFVQVMEQMLVKYAPQILH